MYLGPHHFQAQAAFFESCLNFTSSLLWFAPYGLTACELDAEALRNGVVSVVHARGIFPDGLAFHMPESDQPPEPRNISEPFPPTRDRLLVMLAVPEYHAGGANCALEDSVEFVEEDVRFRLEERRYTDENTGREEKPVGLAKKNIRLALETEALDGLVTLPLARVRRDGAGGFLYDDAFIPPCLQVGASERLLLIGRRLLEMLTTKGSSLRTVARGHGKLQSGLSPQQIATFWFLHAINSALAPLRHLISARYGHPEEFYTELLRLGGALCTFGLESHPKQLPLYDHMDLEGCFGALDEHIRRHLELIVPSNCLSIPLQSVSNYFYEGMVADDRCFGRSRWILSVHARIGEAELIRNTMQLVKVCSAKHVSELVRRAMPGMELMHLPAPPAAISPRVDCQYFALSKSGPCWESVMKTKRVGVYAPGEIPAPELELLVLLDT